MTQSAILFWMRRDLRLSDHEGLSQAAQTGRPVIPVFIHDEAVDGLGAAPKWRMGLAVSHFQEVLQGIGSDLVLRRGPALDVLKELIAETGAGAVWWSRGYDPASIARDTAVKSSLKAQGVAAHSFAGHVLFEPWSVQTKTGGYYKVFTPMWKAVRGRDLAPCVPAVRALPAPSHWPASEDISTWGMGAGMQRGMRILSKHVVVGEAAAQARLAEFIDLALPEYALARDQMGIRGTSMLSENLTYGEISPRMCFHAGRMSLSMGQSGAEVFLKELVWRDFAYHLAFHTPHIISENWRAEWDAFPWNTDETTPEVVAWTQGRTGVHLVDAAMRELYVTGYMHNRGRMIVASYLTKHLMTHWKIGQAWFAQCLLDWDPASNAMGWQWSAGCGPDASPYFRVFNPDTQAEKFDPDRRYRARYLAQAYADCGEEARDYFRAIPASWGLSFEDAYPPQPIVGLAQGRQRALEAYKTRG
ncbi:deoxyribodipyrimidine photo-lyase [uncultured Litoreibacter sp.]|uniref:cryptochrome/photolyase family protein n=1 Tax=uncultured Litoreibacter sp. TaxID=1392394 RepID=UPI002612DD0F|nr:deoxyribodipyrimidine photo-lyase [uncultured Litoreibacter sp.]